MILGKLNETDKSYLKKWLQISRYYATNWNNFNLECSTHPEWELMYVVHGRCTVTCMQEGREIVCDLRSGEYIFFEGNLKHQLYVEKDMVCRIMNLEGRITETTCPYCIQMLEADNSVVSLFKSEKSVLIGSDDGRLGNIVKDIIQELEENRCHMTGNNTAMLNFLLGEFVLVLARQSVKKNKLPRGQIIYVRKVQEYLEKYFDRAITIPMIAEHIGISEGYLQRLYKEEKGYSIIEEINNLRVEKAKILLEKTSLHMTEVAIYVGFNSRQHFTATFKKRTGCSPMDWRKKHIRSMY